MRPYWDISAPGIRYSLLRRKDKPQSRFCLNTPLPESREDCWKTPPSVAVRTRTASDIVEAAVAQLRICMREVMVMMEKIESLMIFYDRLRWLWVDCGYPPLFSRHPRLFIGATQALCSHTESLSLKCLCRHYRDPAPITLGDNLPRSLLRISCTQCGLKALRSWFNQHQQNDF